MRYSRTLSAPFLDILTGPLAPLLEYRPENEGKDYYLYNSQLRERDEFMVYCGTSRVFVCKYNQRHNALKISAAPTYQKVSPDLMRSWDCGNSTAMKDLAALLIEHLRNVDSHVPRGHYHNKKEGYWQNRICVDFGKCWDPSDEWLIIDREVVIGFDNTSAKQAALLPIIRPYKAAVEQLTEEEPKKWGKPGKKSFGDELDLLAIDPLGNLVCIELKYGTNAAGVYWGMYQASVYRDLAKIASERIITGVKELATQKIELGLLPRSAEERVRLIDSKKSDIRTVLAVAAPNPLSSCWKKLVETVNRRPEAEMPLVLVESAKGSTSAKPRVALRTLVLSEVLDSI